MITFAENEAQNERLIQVTIMFSKRLYFMSQVAQPAVRGPKAQFSYRLQ